MSKDDTERRIALEMVPSKAHSDTYHTLNLPQDMQYSKILPHSPEFGDQYYIGDVYDDDRRAIAQEWEINSQSMPYLTHIKTLSAFWPQLRYLADFMEVGTTPLRWKFIKDSPLERKERSIRVCVTVLDFVPDREPKQSTFRNPNHFENFVNDTKGDIQTESLRLYIVEDLSRKVIELLGRKYDVDPLFFREQMDEYAWFNVRDRWVSPPTQLATKKRRNWFRIRHVRPRYFKSKESLEKARDQSAVFNVLRRPDDDGNNWGYMDQKGSLVGLTRTRTSIWIGKDLKTEKPVGIILVDPTVKEGHPLWHGCNDWTIPPSMQSPVSRSSPARDNLYEQLIDWTLTFPWTTMTDQPSDPVDMDMIVEPIFHIVSAEWLLMCDYLKTRVSQIEWELGFPERFRVEGELIDRSLRKLHTWRRLIPLFHEMVSEILMQSLPLAHYLTSDVVSRWNAGQRSRTQHFSSNSEFGLSETQEDFKRVLIMLDELQARTDRLSAVVTASMSIEDSRRGIQENQNIAKLAWLATIFVPMTFMTGFFSMQTDFSELRDSIGWCFLVTVPLTVLTLVLATNARLQGFLWRLYPRHSIWKRPDRNK